MGAMMGHVRGTRRFGKGTRVVALAVGMTLGGGVGGISIAPACELHAISGMSLNLSNSYGTSTNTTVNNTVSTILADVQQVRFDLNNSYINATGVPSHAVGPWPSNPNMAANQNWLYRVPLSPQVQTSTKTATALGSIGFMVNGVPFFNASDGMSYQNRNIWHQNANVVEAPSFDAGKGHPQQNGAYHYHQSPTLLRAQLGDDGSHHSPLIGFAFDGFPVYGPYGYVNTNGTGGVERLDSSYKLRNITTRTTLTTGGATLPAMQQGPAVSGTFPLGYYLEDYEYSSGYGDLDQYNGRFSITPEYPSGTYAYFTTLDSLGAAAYPYIVGPSYYGVLQNDNRTQTVSVPGGVTTFAATLSATWTSGSNGELCGATNWSGGVAPLGVGASATFPTVAGAPVGGVTVDLDSAQRLGSLLFSSTKSYALGGTGQMTLVAASGSTVTVTAGSHLIAAPLALGTSTTFDVASGASLTVSNLQKVLAPITKGGGGTLEVSGLSCGSITVTGGKLKLGASATAHRVTSLTVSGGAKVDLTNGKMVLVGTGAGSWNGSAYTGATGLIALGRNTGAWDGSGIVTSQTDAQSGYTSIGIATATETGRTGASFAGVTLGASDTMVMYTYGGDADLSGNVDVDDYGQIDFNASIGGSLTGWFNGDFDYNGHVDVDDYGIIDFVVNIQGVPFSTATGSAQLTAVPEPVIGLFPIALLLARARFGKR